MVAAGQDHCHDCRCRWQGCGEGLHSLRRLPAAHQ
jgi:hypothetical protein